MTAVILAARGFEGEEYQMMEDASNGGVVEWMLLTSFRSVRKML